MENSLSTANNNNSTQSKNGFDTLADKAANLLRMNPDHHEGKATKAIENQTSKIPSGVYLTLAISSMVVSAAIAATSRRKDLANFVGMWAPSLLILGLYNKVVKTHWSDSRTPA